MRIHQLKSRNIKRLKHVEMEIKPGQSLVVISGKNAQGKSSTLDSIAMLLGGEKLVPSKPIRDGEKAAFIEADLGEVTIRRDFTLKGSKLTITANKDKMPKSSPQTWLNARIGNIAFDPLEFARMKPAAQREKLLSMVKMTVSPDKLDAQAKVAYDKRRDVNREIKRLEGAISELPAVAGDTPDAEISITALAGELDAANGKHMEAQRLHSRASELNLKGASLDSETARLQTQIQELMDTVNAKMEERDQLTVDGRAAEVAAAEASAALPDLQAIKDKMASVESINRAVRQRQQKAKLSAEKDGLALQSETLTAEIDECTAAKERALAEAEFPTPGMGFDETGVTYKGVPFDQASQAEQLKVSLDIAMLDNPDIRVILIKDGSLLDKENLEVIEEAARGRDYQVWIERVEEDPGSIVIDDGMVKSNGTNSIPGLEPV